MKPQIELAKARDFSELINDTFTFIRQNFKPLITCFFTFCGVFLVAGTVAYCLQQIRTTEAFNSINGYGTETATTFSRFSSLGIEYVIALVFIMLTYVMVSVMVYSYMSLYTSKGNIPPTVAEVWGYIKYFFWRSFGASLVQYILLAIGFVFCLIPGLWLLPIFSLILPIIIFENTSFGYAFNHSFRLIKDYWWITFGTIVIIMIIYYFCSAMVVLPTSIANGINMVIHIKQGFHFSKGLVIATGILQQLAHVFSIIPTVAIALCYFNLTEVKEGTSMLNRINTFGSTDAADHSATPEEY